jgi:hypothetical protein
MPHVDTTSEITFAGRPVAEMDIRLTVDASEASPIDVLAMEIGTYRKDTRYVAVPEPMRTQIIDWAWQTKRDALDEAFAECAAGVAADHREVAEAFR